MAVWVQVTVHLFLHLKQQRSERDILSQKDPLRNSTSVQVPKTSGDDFKTVTRNKGERYYHQVGLGFALAISGSEGRMFNPRARH